MVGTLSEKLDHLIEFGLRNVIKRVKEKWEDTWDDNPLYPENIKSTVQDVPIKHIISHQNAVKQQVVEEYKKKTPKGLPELHKVGGKFYVEDGNHRIVARAEMGHKTVRARVKEKLSTKDLCSILDDIIRMG